MAAVFFSLFSPSPPFSLFFKKVICLFICFFPFLSHPPLSLLPSPLPHPFPHLTPAPLPLGHLPQPPFSALLSFLWLAFRLPSVLRFRSK